MGYFLDIGDAWLAAIDSDWLEVRPVVPDCFSHTAGGNHSYCEVSSAAAIIGLGDLPQYTSGYSFLKNATKAPA